MNALASPLADATVHASLTFSGDGEARPRFHANDQSLDRIDRDPHSVPIIDARRLEEAPTLAREGFELFLFPSSVSDFRNADLVQSIYPEEIRKLVLGVTGADAVVVTGAPLLRFSERSGEAGSRDNSRAARLIHIDASDAAAENFARQANPAPARPLRRVVQHNIWRTFSGPPQDVPLALCDARSIAPQDLIPADAMFDRDGEIVWSFEALLLRHNPAQRWLHYSNMTPDEVIVFVRHDSDPDAPHHVPHSAFTDPRAPRDAPPRASIEARTIAYWYG
jgi:hypothetical protein